MDGIVVKLKCLVASAGACEKYVPLYQTSGSAGADLRAANPTPITIVPGGRALIPTGIAIELPLGFEAQVRARSGLALKHGVTTLNAPGTIDSDYRGELGVILANFGQSDFVVQNGERIAQLVVAPVVQATFRVVDELGLTKRQSGGFGHTGLE